MTGSGNAGPLGYHVIWLPISQAKYKIAMRAAPPRVQDMGVDFIRWTYFIVLSFCAAMALPDLSAGEAKDIAVEGTSVRDKGSVRWNGQEGRIASHVRARSDTGPKVTQ